MSFGVYLAVWGQGTGLATTPGSTEVVRIPMESYTFIWPAFGDVMGIMVQLCFREIVADSLRHKPGGGAGFHDWGGAEGACGQHRELCSSRFLESALELRDI